MTSKAAGVTSVFLKIPHCGMSWSGGTQVSMYLFSQKHTVFSEHGFLSLAAREGSVSLFMFFLIISYD